MVRVGGSWEFRVDVSRMLCASAPRRVYESLIITAVRCFPAGHVLAPFRWGVGPHSLQAVVCAGLVFRMPCRSALVSSVQRWYVQR